MIGKLHTQHYNYVRLDILRKCSVWFANYRTGINVLVRERINVAYQKTSAKEMKVPDPLFQWRIHFWYFHSSRRGIILWKSKEGEEVSRKAAVITEMIIILTMRLAGS